MKNTIIPISDPARELRHIKEFKKIFNKEIDKGIFVGGSNVEKFENNIKNFLNSKYSVSTNSGTDSLILALSILGLKKGDEVMLPSFTFIATVECILHFGLKPVFVDINKESFTVDKTSFYDNFSPRTKAFIPVHLFGRRSFDKNILKFCKENKIYIIEDCAQSFGSKYNDKYLGTFGDLGTYSFFPSKTLGGIGDGGCIVTNNFKMYSLLKKIKNHGQVSNYDHEVNGVNSRLDSLNSFVLNKKLELFSQITEERNALFEFFNQNINNELIIKPTKENGEVMNYYSLVLRTNRKGFKKHLETRGIGTNIYYEKPIHKQKVMQKYTFKFKDLSNTEKLAKNIISIPFFTFMTSREKNKIVEVINSF
jgi:dTDP-4-amino-4,6-dideoxygalactose transaminase